MDSLIAQDKYAQIFQKTIEENILFSVHWDITYQCNLKCRHCYICRDNTRQEFSLAKARLVLDELKDMGCLYLALSGGEIFLREDFFEIAAYARKQDFALRLITNATLVNAENARRLAELNPLTVGMSIYSAHNDLHDSITGVKGSFGNTMRAASLLKKYNLRVIFKFLVMNDNIGEFQAVKSLAEGMGVEFMYDFCVIARVDGSPGPLHYRLNKSRLKDFLVGNNIPFSEIEQGTTVLCQVGLNNLYITPYLEVYPCLGLKIKLGDLNQDALQSIWYGSEKLKYLRTIRDNDLFACRDCLLSSTCFRCPGLALSENGDILGPSEFDCSLAEVTSEIINKGGGK